MKKEQMKTVQYSSPECSIMNFKPEGIICGSGEKINSIDDFTEEVYKWE